MNFDSSILSSKVYRFCLFFGQISQEGHVCHRVSMNLQSAVLQVIRRLIQNKTAKALMNISATIMKVGLVGHPGGTVLQAAFVIIRTGISITTLQMSLEVL